MKAARPHSYFRPSGERKQAFPIFIGQVPSGRVFCGGALASTRKLLAWSIVGVLSELATVSAIQSELGEAVIFCSGTGQRYVD